MRMRFIQIDFFSEDEDLHRTIKKTEEAAQAKTCLSQILKFLPEDSNIETLIRYC